LRKITLITCILLSILVSLSNKLSGQQGEFGLGVFAYSGMSQIDGDDLRGFQYFSYEFGMSGTYATSEKTLLMISLSYGKQGSERGSEDRPLLSNKYLAEVDYNRASLLASYRWKFGFDWDGEYKYYLDTGLKYSRILDVESRLTASSVNDPYQLLASDFQSQFLSIQFGLGIKLLKNLGLGFRYEHGLQNLLEESDDLRLNRLIPFEIGLALNYNIF
jgi:hypothetical protein